MRWILRTLIAAAACAAGAAAVAAPRPDPTASSRLLDALAGCKAEADDAKRLACYDGAAGRLAAATASGEVKVIDREEVRATRRSLFGFTLPKLPFFKGDDSVDETPSEMTATVQSAHADGYGRWTLAMLDGAVWTTTEPLPRDPKAGQSVRLRRGAMGSYFLSVSGARSARAMRVR